MLLRTAAGGVCKYVHLLLMFSRNLPDFKVASWNSSVVAFPRNSRDSLTELTCRGTESQKCKEMAGLRQKQQNAEH